MNNINKLLTLLICLPALAGAAGHEMPPKEVSWGTVVRLLPGQAAAFSRDDIRTGVEVRLISLDDTACEDGEVYERAPCRAASVELREKGSVTPVTLNLLDQAAGSSRYRVAMVGTDHESWVQLQVLDSDQASTVNDSFSQGCGGGYTAYYSSTGITRSGLLYAESITWTRSPRRLVEVAGRDENLANDVFARLADEPLDSLNNYSMPAAYTCAFDARIGAERYGATWKPPGEKSSLERLARMGREVREAWEATREL